MHMHLWYSWINQAVAPPIKRAYVSISTMSKSRSDGLDQSSSNARNINPSHKAKLRAKRVTMVIVSSLRSPRSTICFTYTPPKCSVFSILWTRRTVKRTKTACTNGVGCFPGTPGETRTHYLTLRRRTLYPGELRGHILRRVLYPKFGLLSIKPG